MSLLLMIIGASVVAAAAFLVGLAIADALWFAITYTWMIRQTHSGRCRSFVCFFVCEFCSRLFTFMGSTVVEVTVGDYECQYPFGWVRRRR